MQRNQEKKGSSSPDLEHIASSETTKRPDIKSPRYKPKCERYHTVNQNVDILSNDIYDAFDEIDYTLDVAGILGVNDLDQAIEMYIDDLKYLREVHELTELKEHSAPHYHHSLRVGALSWIALKTLQKNGQIDPNIDDEAIAEFCLAGVLHDYVKTKVDPYILEKPEHLTEFEFMRMKSHSNSEQVRKSIADHVLLDDGIGTEFIEYAAKNHHFNYADKLDKPEYHAMLQLITIADHMDAAMFRGVYQEKSLPSVFLNYLIQKMDTRGPPSGFEVELAFPYFMMLDGADKTSPARFAMESKRYLQGGDRQAMDKIGSLDTYQEMKDQFEKVHEYEPAETKGRADKTG